MSQISLINISPWLHPKVNMTIEQLSFTNSIDNITDWALVVQKTNGKIWAIYLHGHGAQADQLFNRKDIRDVWLPALQKHNLSIASADLGGSHWMGPKSVRNLHSLLALLRQQYHTQRFILIGGSMGGTSALIYACQFPKDIAGVIALCPATDIASYWHWCQAHEDNQTILRQIRQAITIAYDGGPKECPKKYKHHSAVLQCKYLNMPLVIAHGTEDSVIPIEQSRCLSRHLTSNTDLHYTEIIGGNHDTPILSFPKYLNWLLSQLI